LGRLAKPKRYRALFISDIHLGTRACADGRRYLFMNGDEFDVVRHSRWLAFLGDRSAQGELSIIRWYGEPASREDQRAWAERLEAVA
jgi:UDP-2,3-diacylglucosamine pyrophosphatase LpxH